MIQDYFVGLFLRIGITLIYRLLNLLAFNEGNSLL